MNAQQERRIRQLIGQMKNIVRELDEALDDNRPTAKFEKPKIDGAGLIAELKDIGRPEDEAKLRTLKHGQLGAIFVEAGGKKAERQRPKGCLIEQILWMLYDFKGGHERIRRDRM